MIFMMYLIGLVDENKIKRDSWGYSYSIVRGEILGFMEDEQVRKPRLLAPDLPSNCLSIRFVRCSQSNCKTLFRIVIYCHYLPVSGLGNLRACCLPWMW